MSFEGFLLIRDKRLRCYHCHHYLNHFPIYLLPNSKSMCSRCRSGISELTVRNGKLEELIKNVEFPCRYHSAGCNESAKPVEIPLHEYFCQYQTISCCCKSAACTWRGPMRSYAQHCLKKHAKLMQAWKNFKVHTKRTNSDGGLLVSQETVLQVAWRYCARTKTLRVDAHMWAPFGAKFFTVRVAGGDLTLEETYPISWGPRRSHVDISLEPLLNHTTDEAFPLEITLSEGRFVDVAAYMGKIRSDFYHLKSLRCLMCGNHPVPPTFRCVDDNTIICFNCHVQLYGSCKKEGAGADAPTEELRYRCKFAGRGCLQGCLFAADWRGVVKHHQKECAFRGDGDASESESCSSECEESTEGGRDGEKEKADKDGKIGQDERKPNPSGDGEEVEAVGDADEIEASFEKVGGDQKKAEAVDDGLEGLEEIEASFEKITLEKNDFL